MVRRRTGVGALCTLGLALLLGCELAEVPGLGPVPDPVPDDGVDLATQALVSDPASHVAHGWCYNIVHWNGTHGRLYYPANGGCSESIYSPLVVIMRGAGYDYTLYHYLGRHLAKNGFIAVLVDSLATPANGVSLEPSDYQAAADDAWEYVIDYAWSVWPRRFFINPNSVGLIGHSRGGEAVRHLADQLAGDPVFDVQAVVGLGATDHTGEFVGAGDAVAALYLHGSMDGDVPPRKGYRAYDRTGIEASQNDPASNPNVLYKAFKLLVGGDHPSFTTELEGHYLDQPTQRAATQGYVLAFLAAHLASDVTWYEDYIRGDAVPGGWADPVYTQYSDGLYQRHIDNFENGIIGSNTLGDFVLRDPDVTWSLLATGADNTIAHDSTALTVQSDAPGWVQWNIPDGKRNALGFEWLSLRIGQRGGTPATDVSVQLRNGGVWSAPLALPAYGAIAQPVAVCLEDGLPGCYGGAPPMQHMSTFRVPLADFAGHDDVQAVRLVIDGDAIGEELLIDNVAMSEWVWAP